jgi:syntaxin 5
LTAGGIQHEGGGSTLYNDSISPTGMRQRNSSYSTDPMMGEYSGGGSSMMYGQGDSSHHQQQPLTPLDIMRAESQGGLEQTMQLIPDQNYLRERADVMETVESQIGELGTIFNKLAVMVSEHADMVQRVEDNVDDAADTINLSMAQLTDTLENLRTNRALALKVFGVIAIFIILFITFFA